MGGSPVVVEGWVEFDALVEVLPWGRSDYVIIRPAPALAEGAKAAGTRRVDGTIDDVPVNVGVNRADVLPDAFMYAGKGLQRRLGVRPGAVVSCRLRPADPDDVPPDDVHRALAAADRLHAFQRRKPSDRRPLLQPIEDAARPPGTRQQRIAALRRSLPPDRADAIVG